MKSIRIIGLLLLFALPVCSFGQMGVVKAVKDVKEALGIPQQDTTKPKTSGGTETPPSTGTGQSNLAVSDAGTPADKGKSNTKVIENPIDKLKSNLTEKAVENNKGSTGSTSNLAVSDGGTPADSKDKGKTNRTGNTAEDQPKAGTNTVTAAPK